MDTIIFFCSRLSVPVLLLLLSTTMALTSRSKLVELTSVRRGWTDIESKKTVVAFLHGLDSSSHTWKGILPSAGYSTAYIALDLRGCGTSPFGDPSDFSQDALVEDVHRALLLALLENDNKPNTKDSSINRKVVLVGHSLGGRVALAYAAKYPQQVAALIIEDMDIARRSAESSPIPISFQNNEGKNPILFDRQFASQQEAMQALENKGYPRDRIEKFAKEGRIRKVDRSSSSSFWWCDVNPDFRFFCYMHILDTSNGADAWQSLCRQTEESLLFPCHVLVADNGGICQEDSLDVMKSSMKDRCQIHRFPTANHSIHNSAKEDFLSALNHIIQSIKAPGGTPL